MMNIIDIFFSLLLFCTTVTALTADSRLDAYEFETKPYSVIVLCQRNGFFCSGTLLNESWVLTSAHCLFDTSGMLTEDDSTVTVIAGSDKLNYSKADVISGKTQIRRSKRVLIPEKYTWSENFINDIALIRLNESFTLSATIGVASLFGASVTDPHKHGLDMSPFTCEGYGYGKIMRGSDSPHDFQLKMQQYEVGKLCKCLQRVRSTRSPYNVLKKRNIFLCDEMASSTGLCAGDNGGHLVCDGKLRAIATTVFYFEDPERCRFLRDGSYECGDKRALNVFTDLCYFSQWINDKVSNFPVTDEYCNAINTTFSYLHD